MQNDYEYYLDKENIRFFNKQYNYEFFDNIENGIFYICLDTGNVFYNGFLFDILKFPHRVLYDNKYLHLIKEESLMSRFKCNNLKYYSDEKFCYYANTDLRCCKKFIRCRTDKDNNIFDDITYKMEVYEPSTIYDSNGNAWKESIKEIIGEYPLDLYSNSINLIYYSKYCKDTLVYIGNEFLGYYENLMNSHLEILDEDDWLLIKRIKEG